MFKENRSSLLIEVDNQYNRIPIYCTLVIEIFYLK